MNPLLKPRHLANHYLELLSCSDHRDSLMFSLSIQIIIINKAKEVLCKKAFIKFLILPIESTRRKEGWKDIFLMRSVHNLIISSFLYLILGHSDPDIDKTHWKNNFWTVLKNQKLKLKFLSLKISQNSNSHPESIKIMKIEKLHLRNWSNWYFCKF